MMVGQEYLFKKFGNWGMFFIFAFCVFRIISYCYSFDNFNLKKNHFCRYKYLEQATSPHLNKRDNITKISNCYPFSYCWFSSKFKNWSAIFKRKATYNVHGQLPSPHSELVLGMTLGEDNFKLVPTYNDVLKKAGLVHVVVVSGYNINLLYGFVVKFFGGRFKKSGLFLGIIATFIYAVISGFEVPAVRAWLMCSLAAIFKFYGKSTDATKALLFSAFLILSASPGQLFSLSFILSFFATFGILVLADYIKLVFVKVLKIKKLSFMLQDFVNSLAVFIMIAPVFILYFKSLNFMSLLANSFVLWVVPICTIVGFLLIFCSFFNFYVARVLSFIAYPFLDFFVKVSEIFASLDIVSFEVSVNTYFVILYYLLVLLFFKLLKLKYI